MLIRSKVFCSPAGTCTGGSRAARPRRRGRPREMLYDAILYYTMLYYTILYNTTLLYTILYYTILYYTILYYVIS